MEELEPRGRMGSERRERAKLPLIGVRGTDPMIAEGIRASMVLGAQLWLLVSSPSAPVSIICMDEVDEVEGMAAPTADMTLCQPVQPVSLGIA